MATLAKLTNVVQQALRGGQYAGAIWLEGSPFVEETSYWLNLLIDTTAPIVGNSSQRPHGAVGNDGDRNIVDSVDYITSRIWADESGRDSIGAVAILDEQIFTARDVQKADARPGGYVATGGHGGIIGRIGHPGPPQFTFKTIKRHTYNSAVNLTQLPNEVQGSRVQGSRIGTVVVPIKDADGNLLPAAIPKVSRSSSMRVICLRITRATRRRKSISSRALKTICAKRRSPVSSPKALRPSAL